MAIILSGILFFSGCSMAPSLKKNDASGGFKFSESIWKSTDGGVTWEAKNQGEGIAGAKDVDILSLAINPKNSNNVFAGLRSGGILKTENGGETWTFMNFQSEKVYGLALDPSDGQTLYASGVWQGRGKIFKSNDRGGNWEEIYTGPADGPLVISLTIDKNNPDIVYATTSANEALKSLDGGLSWKNIYLSSAPILGISTDASDGNLIYFITNRETVFRSADGGANFENITDRINKSLAGAGMGGRKFDFLKTDPAQSGHVYLAGEGGIALSRDRGETWEKIPVLNDPKKFPVMALAVDPRDSGNLAYGATQAVYKSSDGGNNWITFQFQTERKINVLEYDPADPDVVYLGFTK